MVFFFFSFFFKLVSIRGHTQRTTSFQSICIYLFGKGFTSDTLLDLIEDSEGRVLIDFALVPAFSPPFLPCLSFVCDICTDDLGFCCPSHMEQGTQILPTSGYGSSKLRVGSPAFTFLPSSQNDLYSNPEPLA